MARLRKPSRRLPLKPRMIVVTEGTKTEPAYINAFLRIHRAANVSVVPTGADPRALVKRAIALKRNANARHGAATTRVWAVFDRDAHPWFDEACQLAKTNDIQLAVSNPCFELWAVFHYRDYAAFIDRHACQRLLEQSCNSYDRGGPKLFTDTKVIEEQYGAAVERGKHSLREREKEGDPRGNPSTSMHCLMESILATSQS